MCYVHYAIEWQHSSHFLCIMNNSPYNAALSGRASLIGASSLVMLYIATVLQRLWKDPRRDVSSLTRWQNLTYWKRVRQKQNQCFTGNEMTYFFYVTYSLELFVFKGSRLSYKYRFQTQGTTYVIQTKPGNGHDAAEQFERAKLTTPFSYPRTSKYDLNTIFKSSAVTAEKGLVSGTYTVSHCYSLQQRKDPINPD